MLMVAGAVLKCAPSLTRNVKLGSASESAAGAKVRLPAVTSAAETRSPALTAAPFSSRLPSEGRVVISTSTMPSPSASVKPKSERPKVTVVSSLVETLLSVLTGGSLR